jgi:hypothetical protein
VALGVVLAGQLLAAAQAQPPDPRVPRFGRDWILEALSLETQFNFAAVPLDEALALFAQSHGLQIYVDQRALAEERVSPQVVLAGELPRGPLARGLDALLSAPGLTYTINHEVLVVTSRRAAAAQLEVVVYRLKQGVMPDKLITHIAKTHAPESWEQNGGPGAMAELSPRLLLVRQSQPVHRLLEQQFSQVFVPVRRPESRPAPLPPREPTAASALRQSTTCEFVATPLTDAARFLADRHKTRIELDLPALQAARIAPQAPVSGRFQDVRLETVLDLLLSQHGLTWRAERKTLHLTTPGQEQALLERVQYDVADVTRQLDPAQLQRAILACVAPKSWDSQGGRASLQSEPAKGALQVVQSFHVHRQLQELIEDLRAALAK